MAAFPPSRAIWAAIFLAACASDLDADRDNGDSDAYGSVTDPIVALSAKKPRKPPRDVSQDETDQNDEPSACASTECGDQGFCVDTTKGARCLCNGGYAGENCENCAAGFTRMALLDRCVAKLTAGRPENAGEHCAAGGVASESGADLDGNGTLEPGEVTSTLYVCNQPAPTCVGTRCSCEADTCNERGACAVTDRAAVCLCDTGFAGRSCETCADGFVRASDGVSCIRPRALTHERIEARGPRCEHGGAAHERGRDLDDDGVLQAAEIERTDYVCNTANVRAGSVFVTNQAQLDDLLGVTEIVGDLNIGAPFITDLAPLAKLGRVGGSVWIASNPELLSIDGLSTLYEVGGSVEVSDNPKLRQLSPFTNLVRINGALHISYNRALERIDLGALATVGGELTLTELPALRTIEGGNLLSVASALALVNAPMLEDTSALANLDAVGGLALIGVSEKSVASLGKLREIGGNLYLYNTQIEELSGLESLRAVQGNVMIMDNAVLKSVTTFAPSLRAVSGLLLVHYNPSLVALEFQSVEAIQGIVITHNTALTRISGFHLPTWLPGGYWCDRFDYTICRSDSSVHLSDLPALTEIDAFSRLEDASQILLFNLPALKSFASLPELRTGRMNIEQVGIEALPQMPKFGSIYGLRIANNPLLSDLSGLGAVAVINDLLVDSNPALKSLAGLESLRTAYSVVVANNHQLESLAGLQNLDMVQTLTVVNNDTLPVLDIGSKLLSLTELVVADNRDLTAIQAHGELRVDRVEIANNDKLETLASLSSFAAISELRIRANASLKSVDGYAGRLYGLEVVGNRSLASCAVADLMSRVDGWPYVYDNDDTAVCP